MEESDLAEDIFKQVNALLARKGLLLTRGSIVALLGLVHLRVALALGVLRRTGRRDDRGACVRFLAATDGWTNSTWTLRLG